MTEASELIFLGFRVLRKDPGEWTGGAFDWIASADGGQPAGWVDRWDFNQAACWTSEAAAWAVAPEKERADYRLYAYRLLPVFYRSSEPAEHRSLDQIFDLMKGEGGFPDEKAIAGYESLGFDVVGIGVMNIGPTLGYQTSPLSTSGMWPEAPVNRFCLLDSLADAIAFATQCNSELPEPEYYYVVQVLHRPV